MTTLGILKSRISDDLARGSELDSQIASAIEDAIDEYKDRRFGFNETISSALPLTAGTPSYAVPSDFQKLDEMLHVDASGETRMRQIQYSQYRDWIFKPDTTQGQPEHFAIYDEKFFFYPTPDSSTDTYKVSYLQDLGVPDSDEGTNAWMTKGRNLIRARAKADLYAHVIRDAAEADFCYREADRQMKRLLRQARMARATGRIKAHW